MASAQPRSKVQVRDHIEATDLAYRLEAPDRNFVGHRDILTRSLARYEYARPLVNGRLLEVGCGRGYGVEKFYTGSLTVGVDISLQVLKDASAFSVKSNFIQATGISLPFPNQYFDSILALEVIEHLEDDRGFLEEIWRVANREACIIISTPNKFFVSGDSDVPLNPFHHREYAANEFENLLKQFYSSVKMVGQTEHEYDTKFINRLMNSIPVRLKNLLPINLQSWLSVLIRPRLIVDECKFEVEDLNRAHTFIGICRP